MGLASTLLGLQGEVRAVFGSVLTLSPGQALGEGAKPVYHPGRGDVPAREAHHGDREGLPLASGLGRPA